MKERNFCREANGNDQMCRSRPKWCWASGGPTCNSKPGMNCPTRLCEVARKSAECVPKSKHEARCPSDSRFLEKGKLAKVILERDWMQKKLSPHTLSLVGKELNQQLIDMIPLEDKRRLCGNIKEPCSLVWHTDNYGNSWAKCEVEENACAGCAYEFIPYTCAAKNLCSGVICP